MIPIDKIKILNQLVNQLIGPNEPTEEDLEKNRYLIEVYDELHNLKISLSQAGF